MDRAQGDPESDALVLHAQFVERPQGADIKAEPDRRARGGISEPVGLACLVGHQHNSTGRIQLRTLGDGQ